MRKVTLFLSVLTAIFPRKPELACLLELRTMVVMVTTGAIRRAKLQSNHHHQQTDTQVFIGRMTFLSPNQQCQSTEGSKKIEVQPRTQTTGMEMLY